MCKVAYVKQSRKKGYTVICVLPGAERKCYTVTNALYSDIGSPVKGDDVDSDILSKIIDDDERFRALCRALSLLSYADNSERTLKVKLLRAGFSRDAASFATEDCVKHGYIKEGEQLLRLVYNLAAVKLRGPRYIKQSLMAKGYSSGDIDKAIYELKDSGEIDFENSFELLAEKMGASDRESRRALAYKYGFFEF